MKALTHAVVAPPTPATVAARSQPALVSRSDIFAAPPIVAVPIADSPIAGFTATPAAVAARPGYQLSRFSIHPPLPAGVQAKLTVSQPDDKYEQEADRVADSVMRMPESTTAGRPDNNDDDSPAIAVETKAVGEQITPFIQRQEDSAAREEGSVPAEQLSTEEKAEPEDTVALQRQADEGSESDTQETETESQPDENEAEEETEETEATEETDSMSTEQETTQPTGESGPVSPNSEVVQTKPEDDERDEVGPELQRIPEPGGPADVESNLGEEDKEPAATNADVAAGQGSATLQRQSDESEQPRAEDDETDTEPPLQRRVDRTDEPDIRDSSSAIAATTTIQRQEAESPSGGENEQPDEETIQAKRAQGSGARVPSNIERLLAGAGSGETMPVQDRGFFEPRFGHDFSRVRVHRDAGAAQLASALHAQAFTRGEHVFFASGRYSPHSESGRRLLAHELTHTIQQAGRRPLASPRTILNNPVGGGVNSPQHDLMRSAAQAVAISPMATGTAETVARRGDEQLATDSPLTPEPVEEADIVESIAAQLATDPNDRAGIVRRHLTEIDPTRRALVMRAVRMRIVQQMPSRVAPHSQGGSPAAATPAPAAQPTAPGTAAPISPATSPSTALRVVAASAATLPEPVAAERGRRITPSVATRRGTATLTTEGPATLPTEGKSPSPESTEPAAAAERTSAEHTPPGEKPTAVIGVRAAALTESAAPAPQAEPAPARAAAVSPTPEAADIPDVSNGDPAAALAAMGRLSPARLLRGLRSVGTAVTRSVGRDRTELAAHPPQMPRPTGLPPAARHSRPSAEVAATPSAPRDVMKAPEGRVAPAVRPPSAPALPPTPVARVSTPAVTSDQQGQVSPGDALRVQQAINNLPTADPALAATVGAAPRVALEGNADPAHLGEQRALMRKGIAQGHVSARRDAEQPLGEGNIAPDVPAETLHAELTVAGATPASAASASSPGQVSPAGDERSTEPPNGTDEDTLSIIAEEKNGPQIRASVTQAQGELANRREEHGARIAEERARNDARINEQIEQGTEDQEAERANAQEEVSGARQEWSTEQNKLVESGDADATQAMTEADGRIVTEQANAETEAEGHIAEGNRDVVQARTSAERDANQARAEGQRESSGVFGWLADRARAFFDGIKQRIQQAFERARALVRSVIERAQRLAAAVIDRARQAIVGIIRIAGNALIAIGDRVLAGFPALRERFRGAIQESVARAEALVNAIADRLKAGVQLLLNLYAAAINGALGLLERGMLAAVNVANTVVQGAISAAKSVAEAVGAFAALIRDIAPDPLGWLSNLGAAAMDGVRNHLWREFKAAVQLWFNQKVEAVLGLGTAIWNLLSKGGLAIAKIGRMAWEGIKAAIPPALIQIVIEKLVSMIIPAAGAILAIVEGLRAAWGSVSRVLTAFSLFWLFLKSVKTGGTVAAVNFARAVSAAAVVVIDFVSNWLLMKLAKAAKGLAARFKKIAQKIGKTLKRKFRRLKARFRKGRMKKSKKKAGKKADKDKKIRDRVERAKRELPPKISALLAKKPTRLRLWGQLKIWQLQYRMRTLRAEGAESVAIIGVINPRINLGKGWSFRDAHLIRLIKEVAEELVLVREEDPNRKATTVEPETGLPEKDLTGKVNLPADLDKAAKLKIAQDAATIHRGTSGSVAMGGSRAIVEQGKKGGLTYGQIAGRLRGADVGPYLESRFAGKLGGGENLTTDQKRAANVLFSLFMKESTHPIGTGKHGRDLLFGAMLTQLATTKDPSHRMAASEGIGMFPAGFGGAQAGARTVTSKLEKSCFKEFSVGKLGENARERRRREAKLLERWGKMHLAEWQKIYPNGKPGDEEMKQLIRDALRPLLRRFERSSNDG